MAYASWGDLSIAEWADSIDIQRGTEGDIRLIELTEAEAQLLTAWLIDNGYGPE